MQERNAIQYHVSHARIPCNHANHTKMQSIPAMQTCNNYLKGDLSGIKCA